MKTIQTGCCLLALMLVPLLIFTGCAATQTNDETNAQEAAQKIQIETVKTDAFTMDYTAKEASTLLSYAKDHESHIYMCFCCLRCSPECEKANCLR